MIFFQTLIIVFLFINFCVKFRNALLLVPVMLREYFLRNYIGATRLTLFFLSPSLSYSESTIYLLNADNVLLAAKLTEY